MIDALIDGAELENVAYWLFLPQGDGVVRGIPKKSVSRNSDTCIYYL